MILYKYSKKKRRKKWRRDLNEYRKSEYFRRIKGRCNEWC